MILIFFHSTTYRNINTGEKKLVTEHLQLGFVFGLGYWRDRYKPEQCGLNGYTDVFIFPFLVYRYSEYIIDNNSK